MSLIQGGARQRQAPEPPGPKELQAYKRRSICCDPQTLVLVAMAAFAGATDSKPRRFNTGRRNAAIAHRESCRSIMALFYGNRLFAGKGAKA